MTVVRNTVAGFVNSNIGINCSNGSDTNNASTLFKIDVGTPATACAPAYGVKATGWGNQFMTFDCNVASFQFYTWSNLFENTMVATPCADPTSCVLKAAGCNSAYVPGQVSIAATSPWGISAPRNINAGYSETICIYCSNTAIGAAIQLDGFIVSQTANGGAAPAACPAVTAATLSTSYSAPYVNTAVPLNVLDQTAIYNLPAAGDPCALPSEVNLYESDCTTPYASDKLMLAEGISSPPTVYASTVAIADCPTIADT